MKQPETLNAGSLDPVVSTPICDKAKIEVLHCSDHGSGYLKAVDIETAESLEREKTFYRDLLQQITQDPRKTRARRLAESGLTFWDAMREEKARRANKKLTPLPPSVTVGGTKNI